MIKEIEDSQYSSDKLMETLVKAFVKTLNEIEESINGKKYLLNINKNLLDSHIYIILELCEELGLKWNAEIKLNTYSNKNEYFIFSNNYEETIEIIKKIKFYIDFQTKKCIKGNA